MTEERKHAILCHNLVGSILEEETPDLAMEHHHWRAIRQASPILEKIDERWPMEEQKALDK